METGRPPNVLTCQHCGATMAFARAVCGRCGRPLVFTDAEGVSVETAVLNREARRARRVRRALFTLAAGAAVVAVVVAAAQYRRHEMTRLSLMEAMDAARRAADEPVAPPSLPPVSGQEVAAAPLTESAPHPGDLDHALDVQMEVLRRQPGNAAAANHVGQILTELGRSQEAIAYFDRALSARPGDPTYRFNRAVAISYGLAQEQAVREFQDLAIITPADARVHHNLALALRRLGRDEDAAASFRRATELAPMEAPGWLGLGMSLDRLGLGADAALAFERYLALNPADPETDQVRKRLAQLKGPPTPPR